MKALEDRLEVIDNETLVSNFFLPSRCDHVREIRVARGVAHNWF